MAVQNQQVHTFTEPPCCLICGQQRQEVIKILDEFICLACENDILHLQVDDMHYGYFVWRLKGLYQHLPVESMFDSIGD